MTESQVYQRFVRPDLQRRDCFFQRIEQPHTPDIYISRDGKVLWAELKVINRLQRGTVKPDWRIGQLQWIKVHEGYNEGHVCLILYYDGEVMYLEPKEQYQPEELQCQKNHYFLKLGL